MSTDNSLSHFASREERAHDAKKYIHDNYHDEYPDILFCEFCRDRDEQQTMEAEDVPQR